ncbi:MAG TPA: hypothetical protein VLG27_04920 [Candidatus Saccharimonadia bacterium]|nr:hypothetical protein [Candidatus Saccharimonadia bacterium]
MAYDPETDGTTGPNSTSGGSSGGSSSGTGGRGFSFSRPDELDPVRKMEAGKREFGANSPTGSSEGGGSDSAGGSDSNSPDRKNSAGKGGESTKSSTGDGSGSGLKDQEENPGWAKSFDDKHKVRGRFSLRKNQNKAVLGVGIVTGAGGSAIVLFLVLAPLKIETIVQDLQNHFMATSKAALENENDKLFKRYVVKRVLPGYSRCGTTIDKHCSAISVTTGGGNPVVKLYNAWAQNHFENKLATNYGIELQKKPSGWYLKTPGDSTGQNIGQHGEKIDSAFQKANPGEIRDAFNSQTRGWQVFLRYKYGRFIEEKYGIRRCNIDCGLSDPLYGKLNDQKIAFQLLVTQRVLVPHTQSLGIVLECLLTDCSPSTTPNGDSNAAASNGEATSATETQVSDGMRKLGQSYGLDEAAIKSLQDSYNKMVDQGYQKWLISEGLAKFGASQAAQDIASNSVPVAGWINMSANIITAANNASTKLKSLRYILNGTSDIQLFTLFRTQADEIHRGKDSATEVGSLVKALGTGTSTGVGKTELGGTASAENTPIWSRIIGGKTGAISTTGGAAATYKCNNGNNIPAGQEICPEESLGGGNSIANTIHDFLSNTPFVSAITALAAAWHGTVGALFHFLGDLISGPFGALESGFDHLCSISGGALPVGYCQAKNLAQSASSAVIEGVTKWLIPDPFSANSSGGRTFSLIAAGADAAGSATAHNVIGGKRLTSTQANAIVNQQQQEAQEQFSHESFFARMFDTNSPYSLVSKMAVATPFDWQGSAESSFASFTSNPFGALTHSFGAIFSKASAAPSAVLDPFSPDPFQVPQYGYTTQDLEAIGDPEAYWDAHCSDEADQGYQNDNSYNTQASQTTDPDTGMPMNTTTDPCILIKATVGSVGATTDSSLLTQDDQADINGSNGLSSSPSSIAGGFTNPFPKSWQPGRLDMGYDGTFTGQIVAPFSGTITYAATSFSNWGGYIELKASQKIPGLPSATLYFAEGVKPAAGIHAGVTVQAGQPIADAFTTGAQAGIPGNIEWGPAQDPSGVGTPTNTYVYGQCHSASARATVLAFAKWAEQTLHVAAPAQTGQAGCP